MQDFAPILNKKSAKNISLCSGIKRNASCQMGISSGGLTSFSMQIGRLTFPFELEYNFAVATRVDRTVRGHFTSNCSKFCRWKETQLSNKRCWKILQRPLLKKTSDFPRLSSQAEHGPTKRWQWTGEEVLLVLLTSSSSSTTFLTKASSTKRVVGWRVCPKIVLFNLIAGRKNNKERILSSVAFLQQHSLLARQYYEPSHT